MFNFSVLNSLTLTLLDLYKFIRIFQECHLRYKKPVKAGALIGQVTVMVLVQYVAFRLV